MDQLLVERDLAESRAKAQALVLAGRVYAGERRLDKPGTEVADDLAITVRGGEGYVSRGAHKLVAGLDAFGIDPSGLVCLDVGASTGGFTEVLLRRGAARVYAVDVGYGQLDQRLRADPRVVVRERMNARHLTTAEVPEPVDLVVCDASFIPLRTVLPAPLALVRPEGGALVALIKPQFEVGKGQVGKGGVVRDPALHEAACAQVRGWLESLSGWRTLGIVPSPLLGPAGNREFLIGARRRPEPQPVADLSLRPTTGGRPDMVEPNQDQRERDDSAASPASPSGGTGGGGNVAQDKAPQPTAQAPKAKSEPEESSGAAAGKGGGAASGLQPRGTAPSNAPLAGQGQVGTGGGSSGPTGDAR